MKKILLPFFVLCYLLVSCQEAEVAPRPNILFIMSDDHSQRAIHAYGQGLLDKVYFPNMERLAREGALFKRSFVTNSICAPSRAVLLTGKYSHLNGKVDNVLPFNWDQLTYPKLLQEAGYATALIGKIHLAGKPQGYDYSLTLPGQGSYYNPDFIKNGEEKVSFEGHCEALIPEFVVDWLEKDWDKTKPFAINYHTKAPHRNWMAEEKYLDYLEDEEFAFPDNFFDDYAGRGTAAREQEMEIVDNMYWGWDMKFEANPFTGEPSRLAAPFGRMTEEQMAAWNAVYGPKNEAFLQEKPTGEALAKFKYHRYLRDYLKVIKSVDDGIGKVLDYLEANHLLDNTIVVYTSDQGFYLGEHGWYDKRFMYEQSLSTPLLVRYPREINPGTVVEDMVVNVDHAPTLLDYAGVEKPAEMQGESWRALAAGEDVPWRDAMYYHYYEYPGPHSVKRHYGVRTDRYKLIHFYHDIDEWELYDLEADPNEMNSVYGDPNYAEVQEALHSRLEELREQYGDSDALNQQFIEQSLSKN
ncbi:Arylsulfatase A [Cyclobacterium xiamenense]|uniref:Arylsulfatase A n=1 Tax=Cyclobacterium xiamenense TaxID=1297121 RepID=A0A1H6T7S2_9BACT|nr:sulfatase [Cyclobacterium xiamenense]SEI76098.1 Arylsulfatase A [Cyclobacterium xiamenense]